MNRQFTVFRRLQTTAPPEVTYDAVEKALKASVGGTVTRYGNKIVVSNGTGNVNFSFVAEMTAEITLTQPAAGVVDVHGTIVITPNTFFWIMGVTGAFCLWFLWGFNILFFVMDPRPSYQSALDRITSENDPPPYGA